MWKKLGHVFSPDGNTDWMRTHASNPTAEQIGQREFRIYFSARDAANRSSIATLEWNVSVPGNVRNLSPVPLLQPGPRGAFDDSGLSMGCLVQDGDTRYLYYLGWNLGVTVPFRNSIGLAISKQGGPFERVSAAPILDRNPIDPFCLSYPFVLKTGAQTWHMWYGSHLEWGSAHGQMKHVIKHATSTDGIHWNRTGKTCIGLTGEDWGVSRPYVLFDGETFQMWFSRRLDQYRLGYARSKDGETWERDDSYSALAPSPSGWDSESISYPCVFEAEGERYLLYCGNGYGRTGFGAAKWENT